MATVRRHPNASSRWQVRYRDSDGRQRAKNFERKIDAERYAATVTADVLRGEYIDPRLGRTSVGEFALRWRATRSHLARATRDLDRHLLDSLILPQFGQRAVATVRQSEIAAWLSGLDLASSTKSKALQKLSAILTLAVADGALKVNPADSVQRPRVRPVREGRALTDNQVWRLLQAAEQVDPDTAAMVWCMARAGLRIGEVMALKRSDVDLGGRLLQIEGSMSRGEGVRDVKGRDGSGRIIPIPEDLARRLDEHLSHPVASMEGWLFTAPRGGQLRYDNWRTRRWVPIVEQAGVGDVNPHDLRHTLATRLFVVDGWGVPQVQAFLGHADPKVTLSIYTHVSAEELPAPSSGHFVDTVGL